MQPQLDIVVVGSGAAEAAMPWGEAGADLS